MATRPVSAFGGGGDGKEDPRARRDQSAVRPREAGLGSLQDAHWGRGAGGGHAYHLDLPAHVAIADLERVRGELPIAHEECRDVGGPRLETDAGRHVALRRPAAIHEHVDVADKVHVGSSVRGAEEPPQLLRVPEELFEALLHPLSTPGSFRCAPLPRRPRAQFRCIERRADDAPLTRQEGRDLDRAERCPRQERAERRRLQLRGRRIRFRESVPAGSIVGARSLASAASSVTLNSDEFVVPGMV